MQRRQHSSPVHVARIAAAATAIAISPTLAFAQQQSGTPAASARIQVTTTSETARAEYPRIIYETNNQRPIRARQHAMNALAADPNFGLARILMARAALSPELTAAERVAEMSRGLAAMANATAPEILLGLYFREAAAGRTQSAQAVLRGLAPMAPNDPDIQYAFHLVQRASAGTQADAIKLDRAFIARFPDYAIAYNQFAYNLFASGDHPAAYTAVEQYARLAPEQPNPHDTWSDLLVLEGRLDEAVAHANASIKVDSAWQAGYMKIGAIKLATGAPDDARTWFGRAGAASQAAAQKIEPHNWIAVSYAVNRDAKSALREFAAVSDEVTAAKLTAPVAALVHQRMAVIEALIGNKQNVAPHLAKAAEIAGDTTAQQTAHATIAYASIGDVASAQARADAYAKAAGTNAGTGHTLNGMVAVAAKDYAKADAELAQSAPADLLAQELRAEVLKGQGKIAEARAIKEQVLRRVIKIDSNPGFDLGKLVARLRAEKL